MKNKEKIALLSTLLILSMATSMILLPNANAHTPSWNIQTYAFISVNPNPIGVGQRATVYMWLDEVYDQAATSGEAGVPANDYRFHDYELTITLPTGTKTTQTFSYISDPTSDQYTYFTPTQAGTYILTFNFPGQVVNDYPHAPYSLYANDTYLPSSASTTLTVQSTPIPAAIGGEPLPTAYWTRPIYGENTNWYTLASNWLGDGAPGYAGMGNWDGETINPTDCVGSQTAHIMWTKPLQSGGVVGGNETLPGDTYFEGSAYNNRFSNPIILAGLLIYQAPLSAYGPGQTYGYPGQSTTSGTFCVDLTTGQQIWESTTIPVPITFGYIYDMQNPDFKGVLPPVFFTGGYGYSITPTEAFDAYTGQFLFNITNWPTSAVVGLEPSDFNPEGQTPYGPNGEFLNYVITNGGTDANPNYYLAEWNSSRMFADVGGSPLPVSYPTVDAGASSTYDWNISIPFANSMPLIQSGTYSFTYDPFVILGAYYNDELICLNGTLPDSGNGNTLRLESNTPYTYFAININPNRGPIGKVLWWNTLNPPAGNISVVYAGSDPVNRVFIESYQQTRQWVGYSMDTGQKLWGPVGNQTALSYYGNPDDSIAYGKLYSCGFSGLIYCYDDKTGNLLWTYGNGGAGNSTYGGLNVYYGYYPTFIQAIGNGIIYTVTTEHTIATPIYKGALARAINATTGKEIWALSDYTGEFVGPNSYGIADGYNTWFNGYDNSIYVVGRGPSQTTVTAPKAGLAFGQSVVISGTVMDISAGTKQNEQASDFPNGVPVCSDSSMTAWMGYVYQQQAKPTNFTGVPVTIGVTDSNHNTYVIGTAMTDESGTYSLTWIPTIPGNFTVTASFAGTNGYWPSSAESTFNVMNAPPTPAPTTSPPSGLASTGTVELGIAVVVIVIVIIGAMLAILTVRKRP